MSSDLQAPPEAFHTFCRLAALSRVYAGPSGESNEKLWIQEVAWREERANGKDFRVKNNVSIVHSIDYKRCVRSGAESLFWPRNSIDSHVRLQNFRDCDGTIRLLIILHHRNPGAPNRQSRPVQSVHKLAFPTSLRLEPYPCAPRLKRLAIGTGGNLAEFAAGWEPHFQVVGFCRRESHISRGKQHCAVMQAQLL